MENWCDCGKKVRGEDYKKQRMDMTRRLNSEGARRWTLEKLRYGGSQDDLRRCG